MKPAADGREGFAAFLLRMRARGIDDRALFAAVEATPRALFVPSQWQSVAWSESMGVTLRSSIVTSVGGTIDN